MATREEKLAFIQQKMASGEQSAGPSRMEKLSFIRQKMADDGIADAQDQDPKEAGMLGQIGDFALEKAAQAGQFLDKYTGAPARSAIGAAQDAKNPMKAFVNQFGEDPGLAPTGKQLAQKAGVSDASLSDAFPDAFTESDKEAEGWLKFKKGGPADISASGAAGLALDVAADPTNIVPGVVIAKGTKMAGKAIKSGINLAGDAAGAAGKAFGGVARKATVGAGHALTGVSKSNIDTYIRKTKEVDKIIAKHGGDMSLAADDVREGLQRAISNKIGSLNEDVIKALDSAPAGSAASNGAIIKAMDDVKAGINPSLYPESIAEIEELTKKIKTLPPEMSAKAANEAKRFLQDKGKQAYLKNGQLFTSSKEAQKAAKMGAREARKVEMSLAPGTIQPNIELSKLHQFEKNVNKNLIAPGKTESALMAAGSGSNARSVKNLKDIGEATGYDVLTKAQDLSAARSFADPGVLPVDTTGKSFTRMAVGGTLGSAVAGPVGTVLGMAATSPTVLKKAIQAGDVSADLIKKLAGGAKGLTDEVIEAAVKTAQTDRGRAMIRTFEKAAKSKSIQETNKVADEKKFKGEEKWARDGFEKVTASSSPELRAKYEKMKDALLKSKKGRQVLISISDLKPGSKAFENAVKKLEKEGVQ